MLLGKKQVPKQKGQKSLLEMYGMGIAKTSNKQTCSRIFQQHKETVTQLLEQERLPRLGSGALLALTCSWTQLLLRSEVCDIPRKTIATAGKNMNQHAWGPNINKQSEERANRQDGWSQPCAKSGGTKPTRPRCFFQGGFNMFQFLSTIALGFIQSEQRAAGGATLATPWSLVSNVSRYSLKRLYKWDWWCYCYCHLLSIAYFMLIVLSVRLPFLIFWESRTLWTT